MKNEKRIYVTLMFIMNLGVAALLLLNAPAVSVEGGWKWVFVVIEIFLALKVATIITVITVLIGVTIYAYARKYVFK